MRFSLWIFSCRAATTIRSTTFFLHDALPISGKSSFVGLLLGWHRPACGELLVDGVPLDAHKLEDLRCQTAWVDPAVHLWNRDRKSTRLNSSHLGISYAVFCLKKKTEFEYRNN